MAERHRADEGAELDALRLVGRDGERNPGLEGGLGAPAHQREEVVGAPEGVEPEVLDAAAELPPALPGQALLSLDHDSELHSSSLWRVRS